ncbi:MAG: hypothetical protein V8Q79_02910 [Christensenellales bacterium]
MNDLPDGNAGEVFEVWENVKNRLREQDFNAVQTASELKAGSARSDWTVKAILP